MKVTSTTGILFKAGLVVTVGILAINAAIYWRNMGFRLSVDILSLAMPVTAFTWLSLAGFGVAMRFLVHGRLVGAIALVLLHVAALGYLLFRESHAREGAEFLRLFAIQLTFVIVVLCVGVAKPLIARQS